MKLDQGKIMLRGRVPPLEGGICAITGAGNANYLDCIEAIFNAKVNLGKKK